MFSQMLPDEYRQAKAKTEMQCNLYFQDKMFHFWFNTYFVQDKESQHFSNGSTSYHETSNGEGHSLRNPNLLTLTLTKDELDRANRDKSHKIFSPDFKVSLIRGLYWYSHPMSLGFFP